MGQEAGGPPRGRDQVPTPQNPTNGAPLVADRRRQIDVIGAAACACVSVSSQPHGSMCRGGRRPGVGVKKGSKRGPYTKKAATKKRSQPTDASTAMLAAFVASGKYNEALRDGHDDGAPAAAAP